MLILQHVSFSYYAFLVNHTISITHKQQGTNIFNIYILFSYRYNCIIITYVISTFLIVYYFIIKNFKIKLRIIIF